VASILGIGLKRVPPGFSGSKALLGKVSSFCYHKITLTQNQGVNKMHFCKYKGFRRTSHPLTDGVEYTFIFSLTPEEKRGQPDEAHSQSDISVAVSCSDSQCATWGYDCHAAEVFRILYWLAEEQVKKGKIKTDQVNKLSWREFPEIFQTKPPDVSRIEVPPLNGFSVNIKKLSKLGFHQ